MLPLWGTWVFQNLKTFMLSTQMLSLWDSKESLLMVYTVMWSEDPEFGIPDTEPTGPGDR